MKRFNFIVVLCTSLLFLSSCSDSSDYYDPLGISAPEYDTKIRMYNNIMCEDGTHSLLDLYISESTVFDQYKIVDVLSVTTGNWSDYAEVYGNRYYSFDGFLKVCGTTVRGTYNGLYLEPGTYNFVLDLNENYELIVYTVSNNSQTSTSSESENKIMPEMHMEVTEGDVYLLKMAGNMSK